MGYRGVVFDMDGTLVRHQIGFQQLHDELGVPQGQYILDWILSHPHEEQGPLWAVLDNAEKEAALKAQQLEGADHTLTWLQNNNIPYAVLTRNSQVAFELTASRCALHGADLVITRDHAPAKPATAALAPVLDQWQVSPTDLVHVGDYLIDLEFARATGMHSILINDEGSNPFHQACDHVVRSHTELLGYFQALSWDPLN